MLVGHEKAWCEWVAAMASGRMHHAWILTGPRGVGKGAFARAAAAALVKEPGVHQPEAGAHPDIIVLDHLPSNEDEERKREEGKPFQIKRNITIDQIRRMQHRLTTRPTLGNRRVIVIDPADDLEKSAVNALLKSLEEPPSGTHFLLVTHRVGRLLPTIRSRCRILRFAPVAEADLNILLQNAAPGIDTAARAAVVAAAEGSPGVALEFLGQGLGPLHMLMQRILREGDGDFSLRGKLAAEVGARPDRQRQLAALELARTTIAGEIGKGGRNRQLKIIEAHGTITRLAAQAPTYNFDAGLLVMEIGGLLASAALPRESTA
ncbi:MAG TPA: AAA family ATPase [Novosphingobium sp.]